jgi:hypothetical protein
LFLGRGGQQLPGAFRVADRRLWVEAEHRGQVERVRAPGESLVELAVDPQSLEGGGQAAEPAHLLRRVSPAELLARGRDEVTGYGGEIIANEEDDL